MITIIDYGGSNLASLVYSLNRLGVSANISQDAKVITNSSHVLLPGVTSASTAMKNLANLGLIDVIRSLTQPVLGICLGMQILFDHSQEGDITCLSIIPGKVKKLIPSDNLTVPHMGWNALLNVSDIAIMKGVAEQSYVYYVHSYAAPVGSQTTAVTSHSSDFSAAVQCRNYFGAQFHPERSGSVGSLIIKNFLEL
ncbi:MAG: imidazole glycerol phosphate synthase subunit HisH [Gammaproteobacteria bacterium]|nr:imidazole glycerol phosphate synthase subunit HisH [Gammaproteobacteria bacterium]